MNASTAWALRVQVLGRVRAWSGERELNLGPPRQRAVLAMLAVHANQLVTRDELIDAIWGDRTPPSASGSVYIYINGLRQVLEPGRAYREPGEILSRAGSGYTLFLDPGQSDLAVFVGNLHRAKRAATENDHGAVVEALDAALALWQSAPLHDIPGPWAETQRSQWEELYAAAVEDRAEAVLYVRPDADLITQLSALAAEHPLRERPRALLMTALYLAGRRADALEVYTDTRRQLIDEIGVEPGPKLQQLHRDILNSRELGLVAQMDDRRPPTSQIIPRQLPRPVPHFTGRTAELLALTGLINDTSKINSTIIISAIEGTAGIGKTTLAIHWAHQAASRFGDGQLYVNLRGFDPAGVPVTTAEAVQGFLEALAVPPERIPSTIDAQVALYRSLVADKCLLVVLDNARDAAQVRPLLPSGPACVAIVTSRNQLTSLVATEASHSLTLGLLTASEAREMLTQRLGLARVVTEPDAIDAIIGCCGRLPLALAVVAARAATQPGLPLATLADQLRDARTSLDVLTAGDITTDVRAVFSWSYRTLTPGAARLFRLLGIHPGPDTSTQAAASLATVPPPQVRLLLTELTCAHLITEHVPDRYILHDLLRLYARERAQQEETIPERDAAMHRLLNWYLGTANAAAKLLYPEALRLPQPPAPSDVDVDEPDNHTQALAWLDNERTNLIAAARHAADQGPREFAWLLSDALSRYLKLQMHIGDWLTIAGTAATATESGHDLRAQAAIHASLGDAHLGQGRHAEAEHHHARALHLSEEANWPESQAMALGSLGNVYLRTGKPKLAVDYLTRALTLDRKTGRTVGAATKLSNLGYAHLHLGQLELAARRYTQALELHRRAGSLSGETAALTNRGEAYHQLGRHAQALDDLTTALTLARRIGFRTAEADTLRALAALRNDLGDKPQALHLAQESLALAQDDIDQYVKIDALNTLACIHYEFNQDPQAIQLHITALELARNAAAHYAEITALIGLADAHLHHDASQSLTYAEAALTEANQSQYRILEGHAHTTLAHIHHSAGRHATAIEHAQQALAIHNYTGHQAGRTRAKLALEL